MQHLCSLIHPKPLLVLNTLIAKFGVLRPFRAYLMLIRHLFVRG